MDSLRTRRLVLALLVVGACAASPVPAAEPAVILLSWDGVRHDDPERGGLPGLARLEAQGARAQALVPVHPSNTFPNHVSLATGTHPDRHGIVGNVFLDPQRGRFDYDDDASWIEAEPLWVAAERQGVRSAAFFWVGSETEWRGRAASDRRVPFDSSVPESEKVDQILAWLDRPPETRPRLILSWWHGTDGAGHRHGPDSGAVTRALRAQDAELRRLLDGLDARKVWGHTTLLLVSDHGMVELTDPIDVVTPLARLGIEFQVVPGGGVAFLHLADPEAREAVRAALARIEGVRVHASDGLPAGWRLAFRGRTGDLVLSTDPPRYFPRLGSVESALARLSKLAGRRVGGHGFDPATTPEMHGVFFALGRGVPAGRRLGRVRVVDVAATVAGLLGIDPPAASEGAPIAGIGVEAAQSPPSAAAAASITPTR